MPGYSKVWRSGKGGGGGGGGLGSGWVGGGCGEEGEGASSISSSSFITGENRGSRGVNVLLLHRGLVLSPWQQARRKKKHAEVHFLAPKKKKEGRDLFVTCFSGLWDQLHFQIEG